MKSALRGPFSKGAAAVVLKPFTFGGKSYKTGSKFPWQKLSCSERKARQLWENRFIGDDEAAPTTKPQPKGNATKGAKTDPVSTPAEPTEPAPAENV